MLERNWERAIPFVSDNTHQNIVLKKARKKPIRPIPVVIVKPSVKKVIIAYCLIVRNVKCKILWFENHLIQQRWDDSMNKYQNKIFNIVVLGWILKRKEVLRNYCCCQKMMLPLPPPLSLSQSLFVFWINSMLWKGGRWVALSSFLGPVANHIEWLYIAQ